MRKSVLMVDNFDSFTYNVVHYLESNKDVDVTVIRNDRLEAINLKDFDGVVTSPGPGLPNEAGDLLSFTKTTSLSKPLLGICLGMQAIVEVAGGRLVNMPEVLHGRQTEISIKAGFEGLFKGFEHKALVGRYHSWAIEASEVPKDYKVLALDKDKYAMAIEHRELPIHGIQFHPESVLSPDGLTLINNWIHKL